MLHRHPYRYSDAVPSVPFPVRGMARFVAIIMSLMMLSSLATAQLEIVSPKNGTVSILHSQAVTVRSIPFSSVDLYINGRIVKTAEVRVDGLVDFLNVTVPSGDVRIDVASKGSDLLSSPERSRTIHVVGSPASIRITMDNNAVMADGNSRLKGAIKVLD